MRFVLKPMGLVFLVIVPILALIILSVRFKQVAAKNAEAATISAAPQPAPSSPPKQRTDDLRDPSAQADLEARKVDRYIPTVPEADTKRNFLGQDTSTATAGEHVFRHAINKGWFSMEVWVDPEAQNELVLTYYGSDSGTRAFDILIDATKIGSQELNNQRPDKFMDISYAIPMKLTQGKQKVRLRLQGTKEIVGGVWDVWVVRQK